VVFRRTWVCLEEKEGETARWLDGEKVFSPKCHGVARQDMNSIFVDLVGDPAGRPQLPTAL
jgi:hypothetical protein